MCCTKGILPLSLPLIEPFAGQRARKGDSTDSESVGHALSRTGSSVADLPGKTH